MCTAKAAVGRKPELPLERQGIRKPAVGKQPELLLIQFKRAGVGNEQRDRGSGLDLGIRRGILLQNGIARELATDDDTGRRGRRVDLGHVNPLDANLEVEVVDKGDRFGTIEPGLDVSASIWVPVIACLGSPRLAPFSYSAARCGVRALLGIRGRSVSLAKKMLPISYSCTSAGDGDSRRFGITRPDPR